MERMAAMMEQQKSVDAERKEKESDEQKIAKLAGQLSLGGLEKRLGAHERIVDLDAGRGSRRKKEKQWKDKRSDDSGEDADHSSSGEEKRKRKKKKKKSKKSKRNRDRKRRM